MVAQDHYTVLNEFNGIEHLTLNDFDMSQNFIEIIVYGLNQDHIN